MRTLINLLLLLYVNKIDVLSASDIPLTRGFPAQSTPPTQTYAFGKSYLGVGLTKTNPTSVTENFYDQGTLGPFAQYRFFMHDEWVIGVSAGFKRLTGKSVSDLSMFSLSQESSRIFRIYHPSWVGLGFKSMYLVGVEKISLPYERDPNQPPQIGVGANLTFFYLASHETLLHAEISRWRGTLKNNLHVLEFSAGIDYYIE